MTTTRYPYVKSRAQRIIRELNLMQDDLTILLKRLESPLIETHRGKLNPDIHAENKMYALREGIKYALLHLAKGTE